jgi:hypothetical protein
MNALLLLPAILSLLVLGAHFMRAGNSLMVAVILAVLGLLAVRRRWAATVAQVTLLLGAAEWVRTMLHLMVLRTQAGQPMSRLALILGFVALVTALSALVFRSARLRSRYAAAPRPSPSPGQSPKTSPGGGAA